MVKAITLKNNNIEKFLNKAKEALEENTELNNNGFFAYCKICKLPHYFDKNSLQKCKDQFKKIFKNLI